jgi:hypothetical protein
MATPVLELAVAPRVLNLQRKELAAKDAQDVVCVRARYMWGRQAEE